MKLKLTAGKRYQICLFSFFCLFSLLFLLSLLIISYSFLIYTFSRQNNNNNNNFSAFLRFHYVLVKCQLFFFLLGHSEKQFFFQRFCVVFLLFVMLLLLSFILSWITASFFNLFFYAHWKCFIRTLHLQLNSLSKYIRWWGVKDDMFLHRCFYNPSATDCKSLFAVWSSTQSRAFRFPQRFSCAIFVYQWLENRKTYKQLTFFPCKESRKTYDRLRLTNNQKLNNLFTYLRFTFNRI